MPESNATQNQQGANDNAGQDQDQQQQQRSADPMADIEKLLGGGDSQDQDNSGDDGDQDDNQGGDNQDDDQGADDDNDDSGQDGDSQDDDKSGVDYSLKVPLANGEKMTVGELKDFYQEQASREIDLQDREQQLRAMLDENLALSEALNVIPENIRQRVLQQRQENLSLEHGRVLTLIPAWKDRAQYEADRRAIYELGAEYGLAEMFAGITDSKAIKFLYDAANLRKRVKAAGLALKQQKKDKPKPKPLPGRNRPGSQADILQKAKTGGPADKQRAVESLLGG